MALIALIAAAEAMLFSASGAKRNQARRQQVLMGNGLDSVRGLPLVDEYLKRKTAGASRVQVFVASKLAEVFRGSHTVVRVPALARDSNSRP
jgi:aryl carrier-like protein